MPRVSDGQLRGNAALAKVQQICADAHWLCESVVQDFGEDVSVQASFQGKVDTFRLWIQVKGYRASSYRMDKLGGMSIYFDKSHLERWIKSLEKVIVVIYDSENGEMRWADPAQQYFARYFADPISERGMSIKFSRESVFDLESIKKIEWNARLAYYEKMMARYESLERHWQETGIPENLYGIQLPSLVLARQFGLDIGLLCFDGDKIVLSDKLNLDLNWIRDQFQCNEEARLKVIFEVLGYVNEVSGVGVPSDLWRKLVHACVCVVLGAWPPTLGSDVRFNHSYQGKS